jgi:class 3 adenylate cyclase
MDKKLTTILCSDVIGYSRMMGADEEGTLRKLDQCRSIIDPSIKTYNGRIFNTAGDAVLAEFPSATDAVKCAYEIQNKIQSLNIDMRWRIGLHLGEVFAYGDNLMGDTVNIAARIESTADLGGVCFSSQVFDAVSGKISNLEIEWRGPQSFKNIKDPIKIYAVKIKGAQKNPNVVHKESVKYSKEELIKSVVNDKPAVGKSLQDAQNLKRDRQFGPATRVLMWRITKKCGPSLNELLDMSGKELVPVELRHVVVAILSEYCKGIDSDRAMTIYKLLQGPLGVHRSLGLQFLKQAAKTNPEAQMEYSSTIMEDPHSSQNEITDAVEQLVTMARRKSQPAMLKLCDYYNKIGEKHQQFLWLWVLRGLFEPSAQNKLQLLMNTINKTDFTNWKIEGESLLDEIKFKNDPGNYGY